MLPLLGDAVAAAPCGAPAYQEAVGLSDDESDAQSPGNENKAVRNLGKTSASIPPRSPLPPPPPKKKKKKLLAEPKRTPKHAMLRSRKRCWPVG